MVILRGKVTKVEDANIEVSNREFHSLIKENVSFEHLTKLAWEKWLCSKGFCFSSDVRIIKEGNKYTWQEYEDHGNHYSGYFSSNRMCYKADWEVWSAFNLILNLEEIA